MERTSPADKSAMDVVGGDVLKFAERHTPGGLSGAKQALDNYGKEEHKDNKMDHIVISIVLLFCTLVWVGFMLYILLDDK